MPINWADPPSSEMPVAPAASATPSSGPEEVRKIPEDLGRPKDSGTRIQSGGGSITTGIAAPVMQPQDQPTPILITSATTPNTLSTSSEPVSALTLVTPQPLSLTTANNSIVQTPTKPEGHGKRKCSPISIGVTVAVNKIFNRFCQSIPVKPGVLRFVTTPTAENDMLSRLPSSSPLAPLRAQANSIIVPSPIALAVNQSVQALSMVKAPKKQRKDGTIATNEFENTTRERDDVQSPAYSDISDDSTPVAESEMSGKHFQITVSCTDFNSDLSVLQACLKINRKLPSIQAT